MTLAQLRDLRSKIVASLKALTEKASDEKRDLNEAEIKEWENLKAEHASVTAQIKRVEEVGAMEAELDKVTPAVARGIKPDHAQPAAAPAKKEFENLGEFIYAAVLDQDDPRLEYHQQDDPKTGKRRGAFKVPSKLLAASDQTTATGGLGGYLVPTQQSDQLLSVSPQEAIMRPRSVVLPAGTPPDAKVEIPALNQTAAKNIYGGITFGWTGEAGAKAQTDLNFKQITLEPKELSGHIILSDKLLRNYPQFGNLVGAQFRLGLVGMEETSFFTGDGNAKPLGCLNDLNPALLAVNRATNNEVAYEDTVNMLARFFLRGGQGVWVANQTVLPQLMLMQSPLGQLVWQPSAIAGVPGTLHGKPVFISEKSPALGTKADLALIDPTAYVIKDGSGVFVEASGHVKFLNNQTAIKAFMNVDGQPWLSGPIPVENGDSVSPFVALDVQAS